jgi:hypothetical protein
VQRSSIDRLYPTNVQDASLAEMFGALCDPDNAAERARIEAHGRGGSLRCNNQALELKVVRQAGARGRIGIVGIPGEIAAKWHRPLPADARVKAAAASRGAGKCYICVQIKSPGADPAERQFNPVGLGQSSLAALSAGETVPTAQYPAKAAKALRHTRRAVAGKRRNGSRQRMTGLGVAWLRARVANSHKLSRPLLRFTRVAIEDLNIRPSKLSERNHRCDRGCVLHRHVAALGSSNCGLTSGRPAAFRREPQRLNRRLQATQRSPAFVAAPLRRRRRAGPCSCHSRMPPRRALALLPARTCGGSAASFFTLPPPVTVSSGSSAAIRRVTTSAM